MLFDRASFFEEYEKYYSATDTDITATRDRWLQMIDGVESPFIQKKLLYHATLETCDVHLFRNSPFFYVIKDGRDRNIWGLSGVGSLVRERNWDHLSWCPPLIDKFSDEGTFISWQFIDWDHQSVGYDNVLKYGLNGLKQRAVARLSEELSQQPREFLDAMISGIDVLIGFAGKHAKLAKSMLTNETDPDVKRTLQRIADTAEHSPAEPPKTFYEALNTILFIREALTGLEGLGISIYGQLDRLLYPYFKADMDSGRINEEEAYYLVQAFLAITDARFDMSTGPETSTTVNIGGVDSQGNPVFNEITKMICRAMLDLHLVNPKLNARISANSPQEYYDLLADMSLSTANVLAIFNDETQIAAEVKRGKSIEDSRLYANGGCQEPLLLNSEVCFRANIYVNLLKPLQWTLQPEKVTQLDSEYFTPDLSGPESSSFEEFYSCFLSNMQNMLDSIAVLGAKGGSKASLINPCPITSATKDDCIDKAKDMLVGGARYNTASMALNGFGTLVDSLYAIKKMIYDDKICRFDELVRALDADYSGYENIREYARKHISKYGTDDPEINEFVARLGSDIADAATGQDNGREGVFEASLFTYSYYMTWGSKHPATPDGRKAGEYFSRGIGPSEQNMKILTSVLNSSLNIPMDKYPGGGVLDINLPAGGKIDRNILTSVFRRFVEGGGSILQVSAINSDSLRNAQKNPESYRDLVVRVYGFSAYFTSLSPVLQEAVVSRSLV